MADTAADGDYGGLSDLLAADVASVLLDFDQSSPLQSRMVQMARCTVFLGKQAELALAELGLTDAQYRMLSLLSRGTISSSGAATTLSVSPPSVTSLIEGLVERGLVTRCTGSGDRRRVDLSLSRAGHCTLDAADEAVARRLLAIADHVEDQDRREASFDALVWWAEGLRRMVASLGL